MTKLEKDLIRIKGHGYAKELEGLPNPYPFGNIEKDGGSDYKNNLNDFSTKESGSTGKTLFPGTNGPQNSVDDDVYVYINPELSQKGKAEAYSHEANGHALLYVRSGYDRHATSCHYSGNIDKNIILKTLIMKSKMETIKNY